MTFHNSNPLYFLTVAREQSITRAAQKLFITQPSLSQHITKLEKALGVQLFDRSKNPLRLTSAGKIYYQYLENSHYLYKKLRAELENEHLQHITMGIGTWRGSLLLPRILGDFYQRFPDVKLNLAEYPISELMTLLEDNKIDFAIMNALLPQIPSDLVAETIKTERVLFIFSRQHPLCETFQKDYEAGRPLDMHLLDNDCLITLDRQLTVGRLVENYLQKRKLTFPRMLTTTNNATLIRLVARNIGFGFMIEAGLQDDYCSELAVFDLKVPEMPLPLLLLTKENSYLSPVTTEFIQLIRDELQ